MLNGLNYLRESLQVAHDAWVLVHDAARPCLSRLDLDKLLASQAQAAEQGALLAMPVCDTMEAGAARQSTRRLPKIVTVCGML